MFGPQELHPQILLAIDASEKIIISLQRGDLDEAEKYDAKRAECVRAISKCQNFESKANSHIKDIKKLVGLDKTILSLSQKLHDEILTEMRKEQTNRFRQVQYAQNQLL